MEKVAKIGKVEKKERVAWHYKDGKKEVFVYQKKSDRLSKIGELMKKYPEGIIEVHDLKAVMR